VVRAPRRAAADQHLGVRGRVGAEGEEHGRARRRVVPRHAAGDGREAAERGAVVGVEDDGAVVGEDEDGAVGEEVEERVQVVLGVGLRRLVQEREERQRRRVVVREVLEVELPAAAEDEDAAVGEDHVGGVPPPRGEERGELDPARGRGEEPRDAVAAGEAAGLEERAVGEQGTRGAPWVGGERVRVEHVGAEVQEHRVRRAVGGAAVVGGGRARRLRGEGDVGRTRVGAVEHEDEVTREQLHVHRRHADARVEELPFSLERRRRRRRGIVIGAGVGKAAGVG